MSLSIVHYPHPTLRHESRPLTRVDAQLKRWVAEMFELMYEHEGIGLAANQVDLPYRVFITNVEGDPAAKETERVFINPVLRGGKGHEEGKEGCLSIPGVYAPVSRKATITVEAYDLAGNEITEEVSGMQARVLQHETDHLDGTLFIDRLPPAEAAALRGALEEFEIDYASRVESGDAPPEAKVAERIKQLEAART